MTQRVLSKRLGWYLDGRIKIHDYGLANIKDRRAAYKDDRQKFEKSYTPRACLTSQQRLYKIRVYELRMFGTRIAF